MPERPELIGGEERRAIRIVAYDPAWPRIFADYRDRLIAALGRLALRTRDLGVHVHVCTAGSEWERRHLLFRDWLRRADRDREAYRRLEERAGGLAGPERVRGCQGAPDPKRHRLGRGVGASKWLDRE